MEITLSIVVGIITGVVTAGIVWIIVKIYNAIVIPWYQTKIYRGVNIEDNWKGAEVSGISTHEYNLVIQQKGHLINGTLEIKNTHKHGDTIHEISISKYKITGTVTDNYLSIRYFSSDKKKIGLGSFLLKITNGGSALQGSMIYMETNTTDIQSDNDIILNRE